MICTTQSVSDTIHSVRVTGALLDDAQVRYTPGATPHALLFLTITQGRGLPYEVRQDYGDDASRMPTPDVRGEIVRALDRLDDAHLRFLLRVVRLTGKP